MVEEDMNCKEDNSLRTVAAGLKDRAFEGEKISSKGAPTTLQDDAPTLSTKPTASTTATAITNTTAAAVSGCSKVVNDNTLADGIPTLSAATSDTTCSTESTNTTATNNNNLSYSTTDMLPDEVKNVLSLSFPRCSVCDTDWYNYKEDEGEDKDTKMPAKTTESRKRKRNTSTNTRQRPSHYTLYPMPKCQCSTRLAIPRDINLPIPLPPSSSKDTNNNKEESPTNTLSKISTHTFSNLAMCKCCLQKSLQISNEIVIHDYRQSHIKDGQPDVKFTVDTKCNICSQKFLPRQLIMRLLDRSSTTTEKKSSVTTKKKGKTDINWYDAVETTIELVGWGKATLEDVLSKLGNEYVKLAKDWQRIITSTEKDLQRGNNIRKQYYGVHLKQPIIDRSHIIKSRKLREYFSSLVECVRLVRLIIATTTIGDLLYINKDIEDTAKAVENDIDLPKLESVVEIRSRPGHPLDEHQANRLCQLTLQPPVEEEGSCTQSFVMWNGKRYMASAANFCANRQIILS